jgi:hypothetical protein
MGRYSQRWLNFEFSGATPPEGAAPWVTLSFNKIGTNQVRMTVSTSGLVEQEFYKCSSFEF